MGSFCIFILLVSTLVFGSRANVTKGSQNQVCPPNYALYQNMCYRVISHRPKTNPHYSCFQTGGRLGSLKTDDTEIVRREETFVIFKNEDLAGVVTQQCATCQNHSSVNVVSLDVANNCHCKEAYGKLDTASILCRTKTVSIRKTPKITGRPCLKSRGRPGDSQYVGQSVYFGSQYFTTFSRNQEDKWPRGTYNCAWNFLAWEKQPTEQTSKNVDLFIVFKYKRFMTNNTKCKMAMTVTSPSNDQVHVAKLCIDDRTYQTFRIKSLTPDVKVELEIENTDNNPVSVDFTAIPVDGASHLVNKQPMIFVAEDEEISIDYTWQEARDFCLSSRPQGDLCKLEDICENGELKYTFNATTTETQYTPILDFYNDWTTLGDSPSCRQDFFNSPPQWGMSKNRCPNDNCEFKNLIYCCQHETLTFLPPPIEVIVKQQSSATARGEYTYKQDIRNYETGENDAKKPENQGSWLDIGRYDGDVAKFQLMDAFSLQFPDPIYFCYIDDEEGFSGTVGARYYAIFRQPCEGKWRANFALYGSFKRRPGLVPMFVGASVKGAFIKTRVSILPHCCGFDNPEYSFTIYTFANITTSLADIPPNYLCGHDKDLTNATGTISSPFYPQSAPSNVDCRWTIKVTKGQAVKVNFIDLEVGYFDPPCSYLGSFIEFSNPETGRVFGRVCGSETPDTFVSDSEVLSIRYSADGSLIRSAFKLSYKSVPLTSSPPVRHGIVDDKAKWRDARDLCDSNLATLCRVNEICPFHSDAILVPQVGAAFIAVQDAYDGWVETKSNGECRFYNKLSGPPNFASNSTKTIHEQRDSVFCCVYESVGPRRLIAEDPLSRYFTVYVTSMLDDYGIPQYRFALTDDNPSYVVEIGGDEEDYYNAYNGEMIKENKTWDTINTDQEGEVGGFLLSAEFQQEKFEKAIYFCSQQDPLTLIKSFRVSELPCGMSWMTEFTGYGSSSQDKDGSLTKLIAARSGFKPTTRLSTTDICCGYTDVLFTFYVFGITSN